MNQTHKNKSSDKNETLKIKSDMDKVFDTAEKKLQKLFLEAQKLAAQLQQKKQKYEE